MINQKFDLIKLISHNLGFKVKYTDTFGDLQTRLKNKASNVVAFPSDKIKRFDIKRVS
tara:strand:- start:139 stop:312 length:174 start_codon:yes stop_codon:yes gene_type:complete